MKSLIIHTLFTLLITNFISCNTHVRGGAKSSVILECFPKDIEYKNDKLSKYSEYKQALIANILGIPLNKLLYDESYIETNYVFLKKEKLSEDFWLLQIIQEKNHLQHYQKIIYIYNLKENRVNSKLVIEEKVYGNNKMRITSEKENDTLTISYNYSRSFVKGMENSNYTKVFKEKYVVNKDFRFKRVYTNENN